MAEDKIRERMNKPPEIFTVEESWRMTEPQKVAAIIRELGCWRLGDWSGCVCSSFSIRNVSVDIACGKGRDQAVYVWSYSLEYQDKTLLRPIMDEIIAQLTEQSGRSRKFAEYFEEPA